MKNRKNTDTDSKANRQTETDRINTQTDRHKQTDRQTDRTSR